MVRGDGDLLGRRQPNGDPGLAGYRAVDEQFVVTITTFHDYHLQGRPVSAANALLTLWLTASQEKGPDELAAAYDTCLRISIHGFAPQDIDTRARFRAHVLRQLAADAYRLPASWLDDAIKQIKEAGKSPDDEGPDLVRMANEILPELMAKDSP